MISMSATARREFEELRRAGKPRLGIQVGFIYGCGGAGFRVVFTEEPAGVSRLEIEGIPIALDAESRERLRGALIDWEETPERGFVLRHPDAALVEFC
jgi:Fe-S cluster assembly iron-binding protein IscA